MSTTSSATTPIEINALGQPCPMPLLMLKRELKKLSGKQLFLLKSSDPHSEIDVISCL
ncbi:sulfurtransferase TusA family protein, partial [Acinetobacter baumannii]|uniref:sulfurtransferase TusA family protein n=1 Tax=Acinetobacter baumannii TaxID=470 RepID=UPI000691AE87